MGMFLSISGVIGKTEREVAASLAKYAELAGGRLDKEFVPGQNEDPCQITEVKGNTTIIYPGNFMEWDEASEFMSIDLSAPVFSFHIHDGDLWMYTLFVDGQAVDQFNPIPYYWDDAITDDEIRQWSGNARIVNQYLPFVNISDIEGYLVRWDLEAELPARAYPDDKYRQEDWQLLDFMNKLNLPYPDLEDEVASIGRTYKLWTKSVSVKNVAVDRSNVIGDASVAKPKKPWWKIW
jgi:hypothetical protein